MPAVGAVALYSSIILLGALLGALVPLLTRARHTLLSFLAFAAGVMLGAVFFHMLPEAYESGGYAAFLVVPAGSLVLLLLERFLVVHPEDAHGHGAGEGPGHAHPPGAQVVGLAAVLGLCLHTLFDGVALGSAVSEGVGLTAFVAILAHKVPSALSLASILRAEGRPAGGVLGYSALVALMVPVGAALYAALQAVLPLEAFAAGALAFSAGTFLYISLTELVPRVLREGGKGSHLRHGLAFAVGLAIIFALRGLEAHP